MSQDSIDPPGTVGTASESGHGGPTLSLPNATSVTSFDTASQPPPSLPPFNDAPIDRISLCFTGREPELDFISTAFNAFQSDMPTRFVIWGMPGLGKSQLALQHANLAFTSDVYSHVFHVSASTVRKLYQGLEQILHLVKHAARFHPDRAVRIAAVRLFFEQSDRYGCRRWLLMIENVTAESAQVLCEHLPRKNASGSILITTRTRHVAESVANVAGQEYPIFELKALSKAVSVSLLLKKAGILASAPADLESAEKLVSRMGCLPLAIEQAGSFMKRSNLNDANQLQRMSDERGLNEMISWENNLATYQEKSVLASITAQLQKLDEIDPDAHKLLKTLAFFDTESIPIGILSLGARSISNRLTNNAEQSPIVSQTPKRQAPAIGRSWKKLKGKQRREFMPDIPAAIDPADPLEGVPADLRVLIEFICSEERVQAALCRFEELSIALPLYDGQLTLYIHVLIQFVLQQSTLVRHEEGYRALAIALICNAFQTIDDPEEPHSWDTCEMFVPHFAALETQDSIYPMISEEYMDANESLANYFSSRGRYSEAETVLGRVLANRRRLLGSDNIQTFYAMDSLARVYSSLGRYTEAESLFTQVLAAAEKQLGTDHPNTLATIDELALLYENQGRFDEAEILYARALAGKEKHLSPDHPSTLATVNKLALLYEDQGRFNEAELFYARALAGREKQLGANHPSTLTTVNSLAGLYASQGRLQQAESLYARALAGEEQQLGPYHPSTLATVNKFALLYENQGRFDEAELFYARALAGREKQLGADHPSTLTTVNNLAGLYASQGKLDEAESLYARVRAGKERQDDPSTLATESNPDLRYKIQVSDPKQELDLEVEEAEIVAEAETQQPPEGSNLGTELASLSLKLNLVEDTLVLEIPPSPPEETLGLRDTQDPAA